MLETPSAWIDAFALAIPLPLVASLYGVETAGLFGLALMIVSVPNSQIGSAVADVFQVELARSVLTGEQESAHRLFLNLLKRLLVWGFLILIFVCLILPPVIPIVFGEKWRGAGEIVLCLAPWFYSALIVSPLSRSLSVLQVQQWKLVYDVSAVTLLLGSYYLAEINNLRFIEFCMLISAANVIGYIGYATLINALISKKCKNMVGEIRCAE